MPFIYIIFSTAVENVSHPFYFVLSVLWLIVLIKKILFWVWLWQLKEYHTGRFIDHFRTTKGRRLFLNWPYCLKIILVLMTLIIVTVLGRLAIWFTFNQYSLVTQVVFLYLIYCPHLLLFLYLLEATKVFGDVWRKTIRKPVLTGKTAVLIVLNLLVVFIFLVSNLFIVPLLSVASGFPQISVPFDFAFWLLVFDIFIPLVVSLIVLLLQPLIVLLKDQFIIKKAKVKRESFKNLLVIGIAGSYGKTSTKEFLATILSERFHPVKSDEVGAKQFNRVNVLKTEKHQNSEIGVSQCILNDLKPEHEIFVCEMGAYNRRCIKLLCDIAKPKIGILTGINEQHMATFGSQNNIIDAKFELIESLPEDGLAILNESDPKIQNAKIKMQNDKSKFKMVRCLVNEQIQNLEVRKESISFKIQGVEFVLNLVGKQNIINLLMAICCAKELGMSLEEISRACKKIKPFEKTMELKKGVGGVTVVDDSYAANPHGVISAVDYLMLYEGKRIAVMPCLIELGKASKRVHREIGKRIGEVCDLAIITTKERFRQLKEGAVSAGMKEENILFLENPKQIFEKIKPYLRQESVILLESRVPRKLIEQLTVNSEQ